MNIKPEFTILFNHFVRTIDIEQTSRNFKTRFAGHKWATILNHTDKSTIAKHPKITQNFI